MSNNANGRFDTVIMSTRYDVSNICELLEMTFITEAFWHDYVKKENNIPFYRLCITFITLNHKPIYLLCFL